MTTTPNTEPASPIMTKAAPDPVPFSARYTDWDFIDHYGSPETSPVHATQSVRINGVIAPIHLHTAHPIIVRTSGGAGESETIVGLVVHPDDVVLTDFPMGLGVDTICGHPVLTPKADDPEFGWGYLDEDEPTAVRPMGKHWPDRAEPEARWLRVWVQARSVSFGYRPYVKPTTEAAPGSPASSKPTPHR